MRCIVALIALLLACCAGTPPVAPVSPGPSQHREDGDSQPDPQGHRRPADGPPAAPVSPGLSQHREDGDSQPSLPVTRPSPPAYRRVTLSSITLQLVSFDARSHRLRIADQAGGPGSSWPDSRAAGRALGGLAAINGGFFTPEGGPLGLVVADGKRSGSWNNASSLTSGCYLEPAGASPRLARSAKLGPSTPAAPRLLQTGPFLVENSRPVAGLKSDRSRPRSLLAWDGGSRWFLAITSPCSLATLATELAASSPANWPIRHALNLDGGRSSELWAAGTVSGGPTFHRPFFNKPVRNFLVLVAR